MAKGYTNAGALPADQNQPVPESPTTHKVITIDPFGVVDEQWVEHGTNGIIPTAKTYDLLTFYGFNQSFNNVTEDRIIGAIYDTTDGKTHAFITTTPITGLNINLYINKNDSSILTVDWGDSTQSTVSGSGLKTISHAYASHNNYEIKMWISSGSGYFELGMDNTSYVFCGGANQNMRNMLTKLLIGTKVNSIRTQGLYGCFALKYISIPNGLLTIGTSAFDSCYSVYIACLSSTITSIGASAFSYCSSLYLASIPNSVTSIGTSTFTSCYSFKSICIPNSITTIAANLCQNCYSLLSVTIPTSVTSIGASAFHYNYSLQSILIPNSVTSIGNYAFRSCYSLYIVSVSNSVTSIGYSAFGYCYSLKIFSITAIVPPTLASNDVFYGIHSVCKLFAPDASVSTYKTATNWVTFANYIYPLSSL